MRTARILAQGDELTTGATVDTNSAWVAEQLRLRGVRVLGLCAAPDDVELLARMLVEASRDCDLLVSGGGLGPTTDDVTAEAAARAAGAPLVESPEALAQVRDRFARMGRPMSPSNAKQALIPQGAQVLENPAGTAPGFALPLGTARAFFFPGVPQELRTMVERHLVPWLEAGGAAPLLRRRFHVCGLGESLVQERLADVLPPPGVRLGYKTWLPYNTVLVYGEAEPAEARERFETTCAAVRARLGDDRLGEDDETLPGVVGRLLLDRGWTLATAESCTAGGAAALATETPGSSAWFRGGVVAYDNDVKRSLLDVPAALLEAHGAVSEECARAMAEGVRRAVGADVGVSITGIAGPDGGTPGKPVGLVCFGLALPDVTRTRTTRFPPFGRERVRAMAAAAALEWLRRLLVRA
ncbi:MAG: CinA family nicotinamide mononucleotide deamidase-related protein [Deltaproteobacteria bacterium]|nr:CinA family nicotinamide mononucleotide deamidase-related protein [Deltaproteobacteria bacterium]